MEKHTKELLNNDSRYSLYNLITILFAVVIGFGAQNLTQAFQNYHGEHVYIVELITAIIAILLSYYGYHFGIVHGPKENNIYLYFINICILASYFF